jgi:uncharacterized protein YbjT (DUF2867 family)
MRILLTGATGYIGKRLMPLLLRQGHEVIACVRDASRFEIPAGWAGQVEVFEADFLNVVDLSQAPKRFDVAFYLIHSMSGSIGGFEEKEALAASNFSEFIGETSAKQIIYLTGIISDRMNLSNHLASRLRVEEILSHSQVPLTALRAGIIIGSGSASFEIIRDLVEKLPVMIAPKWLNSRCQPIAITNVLQFLTGVMANARYYGQSFDVGCGEVLTYRQMLMGYARVRGLRRWIWTLPVMTPRLSSYWLYFITSTSYNLAVNLVDSMKVDILGEDNSLATELGIELIPYEEAVERVFSVTEHSAVISSWKDSYISSSENSSLLNYVKVPSNGCFVDHREQDIAEDQVEQVLHNIWSIGGDRGWYYADWLWRWRGIIDKIFGGTGLRRGRRDPHEIKTGDALDFWRVLLADHSARRLLLFAEMKLPGEAWLEFRIREDGKSAVLHQTATFRPRGLWGRLYWFAVWPFHGVIFRGMIRALAQADLS